MEFEHKNIILKILSSKNVSSTRRHENKYVMRRSVCIRVFRPLAQAQKPSFTSLDFLPADAEHLSPKGLDKSSTSGEETRHYGGISACGYDRALHISWLISKTLTSPHCCFPLWREKAVILFTKASATRSPLRLAPLGH